MVVVVVVVEGSEGFGCEVGEVGEVGEGDEDEEEEGFAASIGVWGSIWQRTRTSRGLLQRVQFLR